MPLHHIGGIVANIYAPLASGSGAVYIAKFSAALVLNLDALSPKVTWIYCVPSHLQAILSARTPDSKPPSCVRLYRSGAAALPVAVAEELKAWTGATVLPTYSMSECMPIASPSRSYEFDGDAMGMHSDMEYVGRTVAPVHCLSSSATATGSAAAPLR